ncbi:MAG TPA: chemotaxis protein CheX [Polyangiaceae bacterium]|nr:chemotaxis protein CheX [Polyangiaceae bacterium]
MLSENDAVSARVDTLTTRACEELFASYGVALTPVRGGFEDANESVLSGVMGFIGTRLRGTCLLASVLGPLEASRPAGNNSRDWIGELTNQLVGRLKTKLLARGVEVFLTTPIVLRGACVQPISRGSREPVWFSSAFGKLMVWVEVECGRDLMLASEIPLSTAGDAGDILMF